MDVNFLLCIVCAIVSVLLIFRASRIKDERLKIGGEVIFNSDDEYAEDRYERRLFLQFCACLLAFLSGLNYGFWWAVASAFLALSISKTLCWFTDKKS